CLPKDMRAITHLADKANVEVPVLRSILESNMKGLRNLVTRVNDAGTGRIAIYGLTFKSGTDDVRESPMVYLLRSLAGLERDVCVYDADINMTTLRIEHADLVKYVRERPADAFADADIVVVCKKGFDSHAAIIPASSVVLNLFNQERFEISNKQEFLY
ncbi:MAG: GDP-mannose 6-dehydrogenase, partial [Bacteroidota bacterium]